VATTGRLEMIVSLSGDRSGLALRDNIHNRRVVVRTPRPVAPDAVDDAPFLFPVEEAASVRTSALTVAGLAAVFVRDPLSGAVEAALTGTGEVTVTHEEPRLLEVQTFVRTYVRIPGGTATSVEATASEVRVSFDGPREVAVGVRSQHSRPVGEITTTTDPEDVMAAVASFGAALQTRSPERSWPTLRGHPPRLTVGDELSVPDRLSRPAVDVTVGVPRELGAVYAVAPLAFYLGARVEPAATPHVAAGGSRVASFSRDALGREAGAFLRHVFTLDCVVRSAGLYDVEVAACERLAAALDVGPAEWRRQLYEASPVERLRAYADLPREPVLDAAPRWRHEAFVEDSPRGIEHLSFLADDLAVVRELPEDDQPDPAPVLSQSVDQFLRDVAENRDRERGGGLAVDEFVGIPETDAGETSYVGGGVPVGGAKLLREAYGARFDRSPAEDIAVQVVCNEDDMWAEYSEFPLYGNRDALEFDVSVVRNATREELAAVLASAGSADFFHYIGHVRDGTRFVCADGELGFGEVASSVTPPRVFLLNGCSSYELGRAFVEAGSQAGVITLSPIGNDSAMLIGQSVARLVNQGFSPRSALEVVQRYGRADDKYLVLGDGGHEVAQSESGTPVVAHLTSLPAGADGAEYEFALETFPPANDGAGAVYTPNIESAGSVLGGGFTATERVTADEAASFLDLDYRMPVVIDGSLTWSTLTEL